jgi:hypothetical protein
MTQREESVGDEAKRAAKREAFLRLAEKRTNTVIEKIRVLSNCANPNAYDYTEEDLRKIFSAIEEELRLTKALFQANRKREFKLRE